MGGDIQANLAKKHMKALSLKDNSHFNLRE
jgi:hypothetical protein